MFKKFIEWMTYEEKPIEIEIKKECKHIYDIKKPKRIKLKGYILKHDHYFQSRTIISKLDEVSIKEARCIKCEESYIHDIVYYKNNKKIPYNGFYFPTDIYFKRISNDELLSKIR